MHMCNAKCQMLCSATPSMKPFQNSPLFLFQNCRGRDRYRTM